MSPEPQAKKEVHGHSVADPHEFVDQPYLLPNALTSTHSRDLVHVLPGAMITGIPDMSLASFEVLRQEHHQRTLFLESSSELGYYILRGVLLGMLMMRIGFRWVQIGGP